MVKMKSCLVFALILALTACSHNENDYRTNPEAMQQALKACPAKAPRGLSCTALEELAQRMNRLAYQLQNSPLAFGKKILNLQQKLSEQEKQLQISANTLKLKEDIQNNKLQLAEHLATVKWLESPEIT